MPGNQYHCCCEQHEQTYNTYNTPAPATATGDKPSPVKADDIRGLQTAVENLEVTVKDGNKELKVAVAALFGTIGS
jgi:hypothetical protein